MARVTRDNRNIRIGPGPNPNDDEHPNQPGLQRRVPPQVGEGGVEESKEEAINEGTIASDEEGSDGGVTEGGTVATNTDERTT
jgi:hypothetical protein